MPTHSPKNKISKNKLGIQNCEKNVHVRGIKCYYNNICPKLSCPLERGAQGEEKEEARGRRNRNSDARHGVPVIPGTDFFGIGFYRSCR